RLAIGGAPDARGTVVAGRDHPPSVTANVAVAHRGPMFHCRADRLTGRRVPEPGRLVFAAREQSPARSVEANVIDWLGVTQTLAVRPTIASAPKLGRAARAGGDEPLAVGRIGQRANLTAVRERTALHLAGWRFDQPCLLIAGGGERLAVGREREVLHALHACEGHLAHFGRTAHVELCGAAGNDDAHTIAFGTNRRLASVLPRCHELPAGHRVPKMDALIQRGGPNAAAIEAE